MLRRLLARRPSPAAVAALLVLAVVVLLVLASLGRVEGGVGFEVTQPLTAGDVRALEIGSSREEVERALGEGETALQDPRFGATGTAVEPMDATCLYYDYMDDQAFADVAQVCYRDDRLVSKRIYR